MVVKAGRQKTIMATEISSTFQLDVPVVKASWYDALISRLTITAPAGSRERGCLVSRRARVLPTGAC